MTSLFFIVATAFISLAGAPADTEGTKFSFRHPFVDATTCAAYLNSDEYFAHRTELVQMIVSKFDKDHVPKITIVAVCEEKKAKGGDEGKI